MLAPFGAGPEKRRNRPAAERGESDGRFSRFECEEQTAGEHPGAGRRHRGRVGADQTLVFCRVSALPNGAISPQSLHLPITRVADR